MSAWVRSILLLSLALMVHAQPQDRCGDCWCIFTGELDSCPNDPVGIADTYDDSYQVYETFQLTNNPDFLKLQGPNGEPCYPFKDTLGIKARYPESNLPQCAIQETGGVCAYKYEENQPVCNERNYEITTYDSSEAAEADGAAITHNGACGVCSGAQDFWTYLKLAPTIDDDTVVCATRYTLSQDLDNRFSVMTKCFVDLGFSPDCSLLWAHRSAANALDCAAICFADFTYNGPPPTCTLGTCLACALPFQEDYDVIGGRSYAGSGITENVARPCSAFFPVVHDPCVGAQALTGTAGTAMPTTMIEKEDSGVKNGVTHAMLGVVGMVGLFALVEG